MPDFNVNATLEVASGSTVRPLNVSDFATPSTGAASETTLDAVATAIGTQAATDNSLVGRLKAILTALTTTAANFLSVRLTDGTTYLGSTAQRLHISDGGVAVKVDGSAVTQPVSFPTPLDITASAPLAVNSTPGVYAYAAGVVAGTVDVPSGARVRRVSVLAGLTDATITIAGGNTITVKAGGGFDDTIPGDAPLGADVIIGGGVSTYYVAWTV